MIYVILYSELGSNQNFRKDNTAILPRRTEEWLTNINMNNDKDKIESIFEEVMDKPGKFARFVFGKNQAVFFKNDGTRFKIQEGMIATRKGNQPMTLRRIKPQESEIQMMAVIRKNKYVACVEVVGDEEKADLFEVFRKDRATARSVFYALLRTDRGSVCIMCDSEHEDMLYTEFTEISTEPCFYSALAEMLKEAMNANTKEDGAYGQAS